jgi:hypothetical protein
VPSKNGTFAIFSNFLIFHYNPIGGFLCESDSTQNSPTHHLVGGITHITDHPWVNHPQSSITHWVMIRSLGDTTQWVMGDLGESTLGDGWLWVMAPFRALARNCLRALPWKLKNLKKSLTFFGHPIIFSQILAEERENKHSNFIQWLSYTAGFALIALILISEAFEDEPKHELYKNLYQTSTETSIPGSTLGLYDRRI